MIPRRSRFREPSGYPVQITARDKELLRLFDTSRLLRSNWLVEFFKPECGTGMGLLSRLTRHYDAGLFKSRTFNGTKNVMETMTWARTDAGDRLARTLFPLPVSFNSHHQAERLLIDTLKASLFLGAKRDGRLIAPWHAILHAQSAPDSLLSDPHPFKFAIDQQPAHHKRGRTLAQDGEPIFVFKESSDEGVGFILEMDAHNIQTQYSESNTSNGYKFTKYRDYVWKQKAYTEKYGFKSCMLLFVTTNERHKKYIMKWVEKHLGPTSWILFNVIPDFVTEGKAFPVTLTYWDEPWERVGYPPYSIKDLREL